MSTAFAVSIGNTRTQIGRLVDGRIEEWASVPSDTPKNALERLTDWTRNVAKEDLVMGPFGRGITPGKRKPKPTRHDDAG